MATIPSDGLFLFLTEKEEWPEMSKEDCLCLEDRGVEPGRELNGIEDNDGRVLLDAGGCMTNIDDSPAPSKAGGCMVSDDGLYTGGCMLNGVLKDNGFTVVDTGYVPRWTFLPLTSNPNILSMVLRYSQPL
jgi:hypothetical protein